MRSTPLPTASIDADLDLTAATLIALDGEVDMNGHKLLLNQDTAITINLDADTGVSIPFFTNVGELEIADIGRIEAGTDLTELLNPTYAGDVLPSDFFRLVFTDNGTLTLLVPEPTTATLRLVALAALAMRRRRK